MAVHSLEAIQKIPASLPEVWELFSNAANLARITPVNLGFRVISRRLPAKIYPGLIIEYTLKPVLGIPVYWMTEITHVNGNSFFADEQRKGPYRLWHHQHHFREIEGGVEMTDIVHYQNPLWLLGELANTLFVKKQLRDIFSYRFHKVNELLGHWPGGQKPLIVFR